MSEYVVINCKTNAHVSSFGSYGWREGVAANLNRHSEFGPYAVISTVTGRVTLGGDHE